MDGPLPHSESPPDRWEMLKDLYEQAVQLTVSQRIELLDRAGTDSEARDEILRLLGYGEAASRYFSQLSDEMDCLVEQEQLLTPGDVLNGRFRILRFLARGGMGEVYEAQDLELGGRLALKMMKPGVAQRPGSLQRFRDEIRLARGVNSPHVCRVHDVAWHEDGGRRLLFFTMEFLDGETLREQLLRDGPFPLPYARMLVRQMAWGLNSAHEAGILHRDFKTSNVMICHGGREPRVVITDFGLSREISGSGTPAALIDGATPAYVAPEQLERGGETPATDIYSLGVVLFEMMTGTLPFRGNSPLETARQRLTATPPSPRKLRPDLPGSWDITILRCLERDPEKRFRAPLEVAEALGCFKPRRQLTRRQWSLAAAAAALPIAAIAWKFGLPRTSSEPLSLAVLPFAVDKPDIQYIGDGIADRLTDSLTPVPGLRIVSRTAAQRFRNANLNLSELATRFHVRYVFSGGVKSRGDQFHVTAEIVEASTGFQIWASTQDVGLQQIESLSAVLSRAVIHSLRLDAQPAQLSALDRRLTENPEAYQLYLLGRYYSGRRTHDSLEESVKVLERAVKLDPKFAEAFAALGWSYYELSMRVGAAWAPLMVRSMQAARAAIALNRELGEAYLVIACDQRQWEWNWAAAEQNFRRALSLNANLATAYRFYAHMISRLGRFDEAMQLIDRAMARDPLNPSNHLARAGILLYGGRIDNALEEYQTVVQSDPGDPNIYVPMADALEQKGRMSEAVQSCERAMAMTNRASYTLSAVGRLHALMGRADLARQILSELESRYTAGQASPTDMAYVYLGLGERDRAFEWLERAYTARTPDLTALKVAPQFEVLRSDSRYQSLLTRMKL